MVFQYALHVYDRLVDLGKDYGVQHVGYIAMKTLRIEKFFGFWGQDFNPTTTPLECGRAFRVKFEVRVPFYNYNIQNNITYSESMLQMIINECSQLT